MKYAKVKENHNFVRDMQSKAILNTDISVVKRHEQEIAKMEKERAQQLQINTLEREISELKELIKKLIP
jgi:predicted short-subunit dehydrogenase-like oxidoreductase (DUF2520 family)